VVEGLVSSSNPESYAGGSFATSRVSQAGQIKMTLMLLAKEEKVLQKMIDKLIEIGKCNGMDMNVEKTKVMRISKQPFPVKN
jgi:hypothetical protein